jgi:Family of unknown function (DUF5681)
MTRPQRKPVAGDYEVGYARPPSKTRFQKGVSGNPKGRPRGMTPARAKRLALQEAYKLITVREGDEVHALPAIQAVMRQQLRLAAKGNGPAQRAVIAMIQAIEHEELQAATKAAEAVQNATDAQISRALAAFIQRTKHKCAMAGQHSNSHSDREA